MSTEAQETQVVEVIMVPVLALAGALAVVMEAQEAVEIMVALVVAVQAVMGNREVTREVVEVMGETQEAVEVMVRAVVLGVTVVTEVGVNQVGIAAMVRAVVLGVTREAVEVMGAQELEETAAMEVDPQARRDLLEEIMVPQAEIAAVVDMGRDQAVAPEDTVAAVDPVVDPVVDMARAEITTTEPGIKSEALPAFCKKTKKTKI